MVSANDLPMLVVKCYNAFSHFNMQQLNSPIPVLLIAMVTKSGCSL